MSSPTKIELEKFSNEHYTFINQVFGDLTVREVIEEMNPQIDWRFEVEDADEAFENSNHHVLIKTLKNGKIVKWCSVDEGLQNILVNKNDTLCQSYSLLKFFNKPLAIDDMKEIQSEMVRMYKELLKQRKFKEELCGMLEIMQEKIENGEEADDTIWKDHTCDTKPPLLMDINTLYHNILLVLEKWEKFGYLYFIKDGSSYKK